MIKVFTRKAIKNDILEILKLDKENFSNVFDENFYFESIKSEKILVAEVEKKIVGYILFEIIFDEAEIYKIVVDLKYRKNKIATLLMECFIDFMKKRDVSKVFLEVRESNFSAINLYRKFNFKDIRIIFDYYNFPKENAKVMIKEVFNERY